MNKGWGLLLFVVLAFVSTSSHARCYTASEAEAEQGIRIHSELMVIGLNCQHIGSRFGQNLYPVYREFTAKHGELFASYETILLNFFKEGNSPKPEAALNTLRTNFANKISTDAAGMRPDIFCSRYGPRVMKASELTDEQLRKWAATAYTSHPVSYPLCEDTKKAASAEAAKK